MPSLFQPGAPGVYELTDEPVRALTGVRMDVCAFAGVAPRGPARVPFFPLEDTPKACEPGKAVQRTVAVPVESWSEYERLFGAFEGPGRLPYALASFFENGGRRAYVARIVSGEGGADGVARAPLGGLTLQGGVAVTLRARDEGSWGNALAVELRFTARPLLFDALLGTLEDVVLPRNSDVAVGALLRLSLGGGIRVTRFVRELRDEWQVEQGTVVRRATFDTSVPVQPVVAEVIEGTLAVDDGDGRTETLTRLGFSDLHPRWLAKAIINESGLLYPDERLASSWCSGSVSVPLDLGAVRADLFEGGHDRYREVVPADFFGDWIPGDECAGDGVHAIAQISDVSLLCVPDLYSPAPLVTLEPIVDVVSLAGPEFAPCVPLAPSIHQATPVDDLDGLRLDPNVDFADIVGLQRKLVDFSEAQRSFIVLLDVPPGLNQSRILQWRASFDSAFAAAYHPWLDVARSDDRRSTLIRINPSGVAAGIIARSELERGVPHGPANVIAVGVVRLADVVSPGRHDELHPLGVNVYVKERDGARLAAARTLSLDADYRQLSVRRLVTLLERVLEQQMQWMVFEPNTAKLRRDVVTMLTTYLRQLFRANAFQGDREGEAFFIRCDDELNPRLTIDRGELLAEIGVAPAEPLEFILLRLSRGGDGTLRVGGG